MTPLNMPSVSWRQRINFFIHPLPLGAVALMALNDHWLKAVTPNLFTGKLSDICGVFYFPIFLLALWSLVSPRFRLTARATLVAIALTDSLMLLIKLSPDAALLIQRGFNTAFFPIQIVADPTDLFSLGINLATYFYMESYFGGVED